jgi:Isochorismatase family
VPVVLSTSETRSFSGNLWPQIEAIFPDQVPIERSSMNSWDDANFVAAIQKTGRKKIVMTGLWTETCVALPTVQAIHDGYDIRVVEDCCGDVSQLAHDNAMKRVIQAGAKPVTAFSYTFPLKVSHSGDLGARIGGAGGQAAGGAPGEEAGDGGPAGLVGSSTCEMTTQNVTRGEQRRSWKETPSSLSARSTSPRAGRRRAGRVSRPSAGGDDYC